MKYIAFNSLSKSYALRMPAIKDGIKWGRGEPIYFSIFKYKTKKAALAAAIKVRDAHFKKHNVMYILKQGRKGVPRTTSSSNTLGIIGIRLKGNSYCAYWTDKAGEHSRSFNIARLGKKDAFNQACAFRYKKAGVLIITNKRKLPCLPTSPYKVVK